MLGRAKRRRQRWTCRNAVFFVCCAYRHGGNFHQTRLRKQPAV